MRNLFVCMVLGVLVGLADAQVRLQGAGATFPAPIYKRWTADFEKVRPDIRIDYQSIGSGGGVKGISEMTVDFGASDAPLTRRERERAGDALLHIPTVAGAVVAAYNLPGFDGELKLTGALLADIYVGRISSWDDPRLAELNPDVRLPKLPITPAYRTDGSGTTHVFSSYLATQSDTFRSTVGMGKQVSWPVGQGGKGNEGVTAVVQSTPGAIGYIESIYALANDIPFAAVQNRAGRFVMATPQTISAAGSGAAARMDKDLAADIWNQEGEQAYPISAFTYILVYGDLRNLKDAERARGLVEFLRWATLGGGQDVAAEMHYAPLSDEVRQRVKALLDALTFEGKPIG